MCVMSKCTILLYNAQKVLNFGPLFLQSNQSHFTELKYLIGCCRLIVHSSKRVEDSPGLTIRTHWLFAFQTPLKSVVNRVSIKIAES